jgi:predicted O-linked N-acetylglucosamine transferase (SPINDLY family)
MDYIITDPVSVPESHQNQFTERVWYLPDTRFCFSPPANGGELLLSPLPALHNGYITFGSFQNLSKINDKVLATWGKIHQLLPQSKFRLQDKKLNSLKIQNQIYERLAQNGIAPERVTLKKAAPRVNYLAAHSHIDIILDTFPYPGGTTTCEALWMGVPTLTLAGKTMLARQGASMLSCAGLTDWIAIDEDDYVSKALAQAGNLEKLAKLRKGLRQKVLTSPLFDWARFTRNFETAMWGMWHQFRAEY